MAEQRVACKISPGCPPLGGRHFLTVGKEDCGWCIMRSFQTAIGAIFCRGNPFSPSHCILLLLFSVLFLFPFLALASDSAIIKIGVLAKRGSDNVSQKWVPTAEYLSREVPGYSFEIVPLDFAQVREAVKERSIDFLVTNSGYYVELEYEFGVSRIATMKNLLNQLSKTQFGGVIFTRSDRADISDLSDLTGKNFWAVDQESLGGWLMALREFKGQGINPERDFRSLRFVGTHDAVVLGVLSGEADAGTVRTDTLEKMKQEGKINLAALKILNSQHGKIDFNYLLSTRLYPEWPFARLKHTADKLSEDVAIALLSMPPQSKAARAAQISGWTVPLDYQPVHELLQELHLGPYARQLGKIRLADIFRQHGPLLILILLLFAVLLVVTSQTLRLNRKLVSAQGELAEQLETVMATQTALEELARNYQEIFNSTNDAFFVHDSASGSILDVNEAMSEMYGYSREEALQLQMGELSAGVSPFTAEDAERLIAKAMAEGPQDFEWLARRKGGDFFWVEVNLKRANIGGRDRLLAVVHDIDARKKAEEELAGYRLHLENLVDDRTAELRNSESSLAEAQRIAHLGNWLWLIPENKLSGSAEAYRIFGFDSGNAPETYEEFMAQVHPADRGLLGRAVEDALSGKGEYNIKHRLLFADGTERFVHARGEVFSDPDGKPLRLVGIVQDITERKLLEQERTRLVMAVEHAAESILITDQHGAIQYVNPAFTKVSGYSREEVLGENPRFLQSGLHEQAFYERMWEMLGRGESWSGHLINKSKDGSIFEEDATISPILDGSGNIVNYVAVKHNVTEKVELEKQLRQAQKLESIGTLAGGVAHDFNNILAAIMGYGGLVLADLPEDSPLREKQEQVLKAAQRAADLVKQILTFSRRGEQKLKPLQIHFIVKEALKLLRATVPSAIAFKLDVDENCGTVLADPTQVHQVIMNLCTNAYHAMRGKSNGVLGVTLSNVQLGPETLHNKIELTPGPYVRLEVSDTGQGMSREVLEKIFEPYFTTKAQGEGSGLGLSLVHGIVKSMGGAVTVYSETDIGTTFHVYLPQVEARVLAHEPAVAQPEEGGDERLLLVDDEEIIVEMEKLLLESLGYEVTATTKSWDALRIFAEQPDRFDLVMTDMTMPEMNGMDLAVKVMEIRKDMPVILCTGFSEIINEEKAKSMGIREYLMKPASTKEMALAIRRALSC